MQKTIEEAAKDYQRDNKWNDISPAEAFEAGSRWQISNTPCRCSDCVNKALVEELGTKKSW